MKLQMLELSHQASTTNEEKHMKVLGWIIVFLAIAFVLAMFANGADFTPDSMGLAPLR